MADLDEHIGAWMLKHWPWSIPAVWVGFTLAIGLPLWAIAIVGSYAPTTIMALPAIIALGPTLNVARGPYQSRKAAATGQ